MHVGELDDTVCGREIGEKLANKYGNIIKNGSSQIRRLEPEEPQRTICLKI